MRLKETLAAALLFLTGTEKLFAADGMRVATVSYNGRVWSTKGRIP